MVKRGDIVWAAPDPHIGHEQARRRPVLIVSSDDALISISGVVTTIPLTTKRKTRHTRVPVVGTDKPSWAICEQVRTISTERLGESAGMADAETMRHVDRVLRYLLNLL